MKYHQKFSITSSGFEEVPKLEMQIAEFRCLHCGSMMRVPVQPEWTDWKLVAEKYRQDYEKLLHRFGQIVTDIDVMHSGPNPIREYIANEFAVIIDDLRKGFE